MNYKSFQPHPILRPFVKCAWTLEGFAGAQLERVLPDGCTELIFHYGDLFRQHKAEGPGEIQPRSSVVGQISQYIQLEATGTIGIVAMRFFPHGLASFASLPIADLSNQSVSVHDVFGREGEELTRHVLGANENRDRIRMIESFLIRKLQRRPSPDYVINDCVAKIMAEHGQIRVDSLRKNLKVSKRHFERKFNHSVGLNPKLFGRLIRFHHATRLIENGKFTSLGTLSHEAGYYDQAHFTRDFKEFAGMNPTAYFKSNHDLNDLFSAG